jgi:hypothetical protein
MSDKALSTLPPLPVRTLAPARHLAEFVVVVEERDGELHYHVRPDPPLTAQTPAGVRQTYTAIVDALFGLGARTDTDTDGDGDGR